MSNKKRIILFEDDNFLRDVLSQKLEKGGYLVESAENGVAATEKIREYKPDLILLDIFMPQKGGMQVLEELHADLELKKIPVIIISNSGQPVEVSRARELGARDFLVKAIFNQNEVLEKVERVLATDAGTPLASKMNEEQSLLDTQSHETIRETKTVPPVSGNGEKKFILVVEDDKFLRELIVRKLTAEGFEVNNAVDSEAAFAILKERTPQIILLDLILPGIDGFEILTRIKADPKSKDVPVVVLSNLGQKEDIKKAMALGARDFMVKANFTLDEITLKVRSIIG